MPRNVRNFWIELDVDGSKTAIGSGPRGKDGGFQLTIRQRDNGSIVKALDVRGFVDTNGNLRLNAATPNATDPMLTLITVR